MEKKPNIIRRCYDWVLGWADTKWGTLALFILAFSESSFFPIPPDVLLLALCFGAAKKSFKFAFICTMGSVAGAAVGYGIGLGLWESVLHDFRRILAGEFRQCVRHLRRMELLGHLYGRFHPHPVQDFHNCGRRVQYQFPDIHTRIRNCTWHAFLPGRFAGMEIRLTHQGFH